MKSKKLRVSAIAEYFDSGCARKLFSSLDNSSSVSKRKSVSVRADMTYWQELGELNEKAVVEGLKSSDVYFLESDQPFTDILKNIATDEIYRSGKAIYIYQPVISIPERSELFYGKNQSNQSEEIVFADARPDFLRVTYDSQIKKFDISVIDVKSTQALKHGAQIQIAMYTMIIDEIINESQEDQDGFAISDYFKININWNNKKCFKRALFFIFMVVYKNIYISLQM